MSAYTTILTNVKSNVFSEVNLTGKGALIWIPKQLLSSFQISYLNYFGSACE